MIDMGAHVIFEEIKASRQKTVCDQHKMTYAT